MQILIGKAYYWIQGEPKGERYASYFSFEAHISYTVGYYK